MASAVPAEFWRQVITMNAWFPLVSLFLFTKFYHKISGNSLSMWVDKMDEFRKIIHTKVISEPCELEVWANDGDIDVEMSHTYIDIDLDDFMVAMILDDTSIRSCRPGSGPDGDYVGAPRRFGAHQYQKAFYSGYFKGHGLKYQHVLLPNGLYGSVWGASHSYNDIGIFNMSGLEAYLHSILSVSSNGRLPCMLGDGIFTQSEVLMNTKVDEDNISLTHKYLKKRLTSVHQPI